MLLNRLQEVGQGNKDNSDIVKCFVSDGCTEDLFDSEPAGLVASGLVIDVLLVY